MEISVKEYCKLTDAVCAITGRLECHIEHLMDQGQFRDAIEHLDDLLYIHKSLPLNSSEDWIIKWQSMKKECITDLVKGVNNYVTTI